MTGCEGFFRAFSANERVTTYTVAEPHVGRRWPRPFSGGSERRASEPRRRRPSVDSGRVQSRSTSNKRPVPWRQEKERPRRRFSSFLAMREEMAGDRLLTEEPTLPMTVAEAAAKINWPTQTPTQTHMHRRQRFFFFFFLDRHQREEAPVDKPVRSTRNAGSAPTTPSAPAGRSPLMDRCDDGPMMANRSGRDTSRPEGARATSLFVRVLVWEPLNEH